MEMAAMKDCPMSKSSKLVEMDLNKCAMYCYGLMSALEWQGIDAIHAALPIDFAYPTYSQSLDGYILGILTPPPNFA